MASNSDPAKAKKPKASPNAKASAPTPAPATKPEHPALKLLHALNALHIVCFNSRLFTQLAKRRKDAWGLHVRLLNAAAKIDSDRANELAREGKPTAQQWGALMDRANDPPPFNEPAEYTKPLRELLDNGLAWCEKAQAALRDGGAKGLDSATQPNAEGQPRSIEMDMKLRDAKRVFVGLTVGIANPRFIIDDDAARMADLGEWFARTRDELAAVIRTRGLDAPAPPSTVSDESASPALTANQSRVLQTMAQFDASRLLSSRMIAEAMDWAVRLSEETVRQCVRKLIEANLAERPDGDRSGARLNNAGRKLAGKIAD